MKSGIHIELMSDLLEELTVILPIIWWLQELDKMSASKQAAQYDTERFNLRNINDVEAKIIWLKSQICLQLWKTWMVVVVVVIMWTSVRL